MFKPSNNNRNNGNSGNFESKKYGVGEFRVIQVNPTRKELNALLGSEPKDNEEEIEYSGSKDGEKYGRVCFVLESVDDKSIKFLNFFIADRDVMNKDKTKQEFINTRGLAAWTDLNGKLPTWFTKDGVEYRESYNGEGNFYQFLRSWLFNHNWLKNEEFFDIKEILKGKSKELRSIIEDNDPNTDIKGTVICNVIITSKAREVDGEYKTFYYENVYNGAFLPGNLMQQYRLMSLNFPIEIDETEKYATKTIKFFAAKFDPNKDYPVKGITTLELMKEFDEKAHLLTSSDTMQAEDENISTDY